MGADSNPRWIFLELLVYWEGCINASALKKQFGISVAQASRVIADYQTAYDHPLDYCPSKKQFGANSHFALHFISGDAAEYLNWLLYGTIQSAKVQSFVSKVSVPTRAVSPEVMRGLIAAVKRRQRVEVDYVSLNAPNGEGRVIAPHSFVNMGLRWHLRAYCEKSGEYRDFVLSRFRGEAGLLTPSKNTAKDDIAWQTNVAIKLQPDPRLPPKKQAVIAQDYGMLNSMLEITTRGCLVNYLLRELQISTKTLDAVPEAQQLVCTNLAELKPWLFE